MHRHTAPKPQTPPAPKAECKSLSEFPPRPKPKPHRAQSPYPTAPKAQSPHDQSLHATLLSLPPMRRLVCGRIPCAQHNLRIQRLIPITRAYACSSRHIRQPLLHVPCYKLLAIPAQRRHWAEGAAWAPHTWHGIWLAVRPCQKRTWHTEDLMSSCWLPIAQGLLVLHLCKHVLIRRQTFTAGKVQTQLNSTQLNSTQLNSTQLISTQLSSAQLNSTQLNSTPCSTQLNSSRQGSNT